MLKLLLKKYISNYIIHGKLLMVVDTTLTAKNTDKIFGTQKWNNHSGNAGNSTEYRDSQNKHGVKDALLDFAA
ncbi:MAG: hypothetical protein Q8942_08630 [Bacillota bacterium]|nr:hypothetical protein [Bacillota bacterium]